MSDETDTKTYRMVEFEDGTVKNVYPQLIRFLDNPFVEYIWEAGEQA